MTDVPAVEEVPVGYRLAWGIDDLEIVEDGLTASGLDVRHFEDQMDTARRYLASVHGWAPDSFTMTRALRAPGATICEMYQPHEHVWVVVPDLGTPEVHNTPTGPRFAFTAQIWPEE